MLPLPLQLDLALCSSEVSVVNLYPHCRRNEHIPFDGAETAVQAVFFQMFYSLWLSLSLSPSLSLSLCLPAASPSDVSIHPNSLSVLEGEQIEITCSAEGFPPPLFQVNGLTVEREVFPRWYFVLLEPGVGRFVLALFGHRAELTRTHSCLGAYHWWHMATHPKSHRFYHLLNTMRENHHTSHLKLSTTAL